MFASVESLLAKIRLGQDGAFGFIRVEVRRDRVTAPDRSDLADEIAAMANTGGGVLVLGVDDKTRDIAGIPISALDDAERLVREVCNDTLKPPVLAHIVRMEIPDQLGISRAILKVEVLRGLFVHKSPGGYFHRIGSSKREMPTEFLLRLGQQRSQARIIRFDEQVVPETVRADLEERWWSRFADPATEATTQALHKRKLLADEDGITRCTVSGVLLATSRPERWLSGASALAVRFRGVHQDSQFQVAREETSGPIDRQILALYAFARRTQDRPVIDGRERPQYSDRALFEALVNAVVHRDYSVYGARVRMFLFDDRLELYSPGALPNTLSVESIALRQSTRNEALKSALVKLPTGDEADGSGRGYFMEGNGDGVPVILRETERLAGRSPVWRVLDDAEVFLTIPAG